MPRKLDKKVIKARITVNKVTMKICRKSVIDEMRLAHQLEGFDQKQARRDLSTFLKAAASVKDDYAKLDMLKNEGE